MANDTSKFSVKNACLRTKKSHSQTKNNNNYIFELHSKNNNNGTIKINCPYYRDSAYRTSGRSMLYLDQFNNSRNWTIKWPGISAIFSIDEPRHYQPHFSDCVLWTNNTAFLEFIPIQACKHSHFLDILDSSYIVLSWGRYSNHFQKCTSKWITG